jgi:predicted cupin superfamily sugar epimerase
MSGPGSAVDEIVRRLDLAPHPEGGFFRRTWESSVRAEGSDRGAGSSILFLLPADVTSRWHRIDATELWQHSAGAPLRLSTWAGGAAPAHHHTLGADLADGEVPQIVVEPHVWQSARSTGAWSLAVCVVVPEFSFDGFEMLPDGWSPPGGAPGPGPRRG